METFNLTMQAISTVGFPIVGYIAMFMLYRETLKMHDENSDKWMEVIMNNTTAIERLNAMMEGNNVKGN